MAEVVAEQKFTYWGKDVETGKRVEKDLSLAIDMAKDMWKTKSGTWVMSLRGFQRLAEFEGVVEKRIQTVCTPTDVNKQNNIVNIWVGYAGDEHEDYWARGSGEASQMNTGRIDKKIVDGKEVRRYIEVGEVDASYRYAMAEKRGFCRAMQKLLRLKVYADVEASAFSRSGGQEVDNADIDY